MSKWGFLGSTWSRPNRGNAPAFAGRQYEEPDKNIKVSGVPADIRTQNKLNKNPCYCNVLKLIRAV